MVHKCKYKIYRPKGVQNGFNLLYTSAFGDTVSQRLNILFKVPWLKKFNVLFKVKCLGNSMLHIRYHISET